MAASAIPAYEYVVSTITTGIVAGISPMIPNVSCANSTKSLLGGGDPPANGGNLVPNVTNANPGFSLSTGGIVEVGNGGGNLVPCVSNANANLSLLQ